MGYSALHDIGWMPSVFSGTTTFSVDAANDRFAFAYLSPATRTLSKFLFYCGGVTGTLAASDIRLDVFSDNTTTGDPNTTLANSSTVTATPTGAAWVEVTGFSLSLTVGTRYWFVLSNANAAPTTNFFQVTYARHGHPIAALSSAYGQAMATSTDAGSTWSRTAANGGNFRLEFSSPTDYDGFPVSAVAVGTTAVYGTREHGIKFTTPSGPTLNVIGLAFYLSNLGTLANNYRYRIYDASRTLLATTATLEAAAKSDTAGVSYQYFSSAVALAPNAVYYAVMGVDTGGDSSNYLRTYEFTIHDDANSKALMPFGGTVQRTYYNASTWADTDTVFTPLLLMLAPGGDFTVAAAGGGGNVIGSGVICALEAL